MTEWCPPSARWETPSLEQMSQFHYWSRIKELAEDLYGCLRNVGLTDNEEAYHVNNLVYVATERLFSISSVTAPPRAPSAQMDVAYLENAQRLLGSAMEMVRQVKSDPTRARQVAEDINHSWFSAGKLVHDIEKRERMSALDEEGEA